MAHRPLADPEDEDHDELIATLPCKPPTPLMRRMRLYRGGWFPEKWLPAIMAFRRRFEARDGDVVVASLPKCGTTWLKGPGLRHRASITDSSRCKIIYVCRQPKDMLISFWHFINRDKSRDVSSSYVWESVRECTYFGSPIWDHILGYWNASKVKPDNVLILKYEDMKRNPTENVEKIAEFIGQPFSNSEKEASIVDNIVELCSFEKMKALGASMAGSQKVISSEFPNDSFFRKGAIGDWVNHVTPEMAESLDKFLSEKFDGSGFTFM
ncbi:hypothetical protein OsJ_30937 [Oryza sativa Japonica Group]|uniref:Sulfotransferase n=1 Tax=Oryza sativa subsp. japonica TaxID=39947 RepID=A3C366_ORYSJ|nr:hypothetical protein OsJ_30937 [Oryza sativa Japonica Group]